jgi:hypothetical protein
MLTMLVSTALTGLAAFLPVMFKKFLFAAIVVLGLVYGSGYDFASLKRSINGFANDNARSVTNNSNDGWGADSGY